MIIRSSSPADYAAIEQITRDAFWDVYQPGCDEHYLVHLMHELSCFVPELDLVAEIDGEIVGHAICTRARLSCGERLRHDIVGIGPLTVAPAFQRQGVGSALMKETLRVAKELGYAAVFLMGNPAYYRRFGFCHSRDFGITLTGGASPDAFMVCPLREDALDGANGIYEDHFVFSCLDQTNVAAFDKRFPARDKHLKPTQIFRPKTDYDLLEQQLSALLEAAPLPLSALSNFAALLGEHMPAINWAGFYLSRNDILYLGPFSGKPACMEIEYGRGVCGTAAATRVLQLVPDVHQFPGHIACDEASRSEIVIPLLADDQVIGVLDIDSPCIGRFDENDALHLQKLCDLLMDAVDFSTGLL